MNLLSDVITYVRRIIKSPSNAVITDNLLIDYINRFWIMDVDARIQLFDLKKKLSFQTVPGVDRYNMPLYSVQTEPGPQSIGMYPVYQGIMDPCYINGIQVPFTTQRNDFFRIWPNVVQYCSVVAVGDDTAGPYSLTLPLLPNNSTPVNTPINALLRGHIDTTGIIALGVNEDPPVVSEAQAISTPGTIAAVPVTSVDAAFFITTQDATGASVVISDSGQFLEGDVNYGLLMVPGKAPYGNLPLNAYSATENTVNYLTGEVNVQFPVSIPSGVNINVQCYFFQAGLPRGVLFHNNTITLRTVPSSQFLFEADAYMTPAAFLSSAESLPFAYMTEYIARGAARKILSDTGDIEQFQFYEPLFKEQELLVWKRSQRQFTSTRTQTIYSQGAGSNQGLTSFGSGVI